MSSADATISWLELTIGLVLGITIIIGIIVPIYVWMMRSKRSAKYKPSEQSAEDYQPYEQRLVLAARANNNRVGCVFGLTLVLLGAIFMIGVALISGWDQFHWMGRITSGAMLLIGLAVVVLMLINFFKNFGYRAYAGREVQLDATELIIDRSLVDSQVAGDDMSHPHLQTYLHEKFYYRIPLNDISMITVSAMVHQPGVKARQYPFVFISFTTFEAVYMIQTRFMGGEGEMRFLKHIQAGGKIPIQVDEHYAEYYDYLDQAVVVTLD